MDEIQEMEQKQEEREEKHNKDAHTKEEEITRLTDRMNETQQQIESESQKHTKAMNAKEKEYNEKTVSVRNAHAKEMAELRQSLYEYDGIGTKRSRNPRHETQQSYGSKRTRKR
eukprot:961236_1